MDEGGKVTTVVKDHVEGLAAGESSQGLLDTPLVLLLGLTLPGEDGNTGGSDTTKHRLVTIFPCYRRADIRCGSVVLGGEDVLLRARC